MGLDATLDLENSSALLALSDLKRRQIPFAEALALTRTAQSAQARIKRELPDRFELRNNFLERGVRIERATKRKPEAAVLWRAPGGASRRGFANQLSLQETGGTRRPRGKTLALPRQGVKRGKGGTITRSQRPAAVLKRKNTFIRDAGQGAAIFKRVGKAQPRLVYFLTPKSARIVKRFEFRSTARDEARRVYRKEFGKAFARALRTAR